MISELSKEEIQQFIQDHLYDDPAALMLQASRYPGLPMVAVAEQIQSKRKAKTKLPMWFSTPGLIYPPRLSMEQCSSQLTATYKASLINGSTMIDLTGGFGVDTYFLSQSFDRACYVERYGDLVALARHNFSVLGADHIQCCESQGEVFVQGVEEAVDLIYLDPARRDAENKKVVRLEDCEPDVVRLLPLLKMKAQNILIKTSPMLDIKKAITDLEVVSEVHVLADRNEVKELLFLIGQDAGKTPTIHCRNFLADGEESFTFDHAIEENAVAETGQVATYLYEPNTAILKAGAFKSVAYEFGLKKLHPNTHLYTSEERQNDFPGRVFRILAPIALSKKLLRKSLPDMKANVTVRNYPMSVAQIRKKSGLKEGGNDFLIGLTDTEGPKLFLCQRV